MQIILLERIEQHHVAVVRDKVVYARVVAEHPVDHVEPAFDVGFSKRLRGRRRHF